MHTQEISIARFELRYRHGKCKSAPFLKLQPCPYRTFVCRVCYLTDALRWYRDLGLDLSAIVSAQFTDRAHTYEYSAAELQKEIEWIGNQPLIKTA